MLPNPSQDSNQLSEEASTHPVIPISHCAQTLGETMSSKDGRPSDHSLPDAPLDQYGHLPGSTPKEKIRNAWAQLSLENQSGILQTTNAAETPSSVGDIEASAPVSVPETTAPLSVRADTDSFSHPHIVVHHGHSEPLLPPSELAHVAHINQPSVQTVHPSALTVDGMEDIVPGSVHLGPSEFAITLPMDSRVKDDYERVLTDAATCIRQFFDSFQPNSQISEFEVTGDCALDMIHTANILRTARGLVLRYAAGCFTIEQRFNAPRLEHSRSFERPRPRFCKRGIVG